MFHLIESVIGNVVELGIGAAIGIVFREPIMAKVSSLKSKYLG